MRIKLYSQVTYLGCVLDETFSGETIILKALNKINQKINYFYAKISF